MLHPAIVASGDAPIHGVCLVTTRRILQSETVWELDESMYTWKEIESWSEQRRQAFDGYGFQCGVDRYSLPDHSFEMNCSCDSPRCRGTISNRDPLDPEWRNPDV